MSDRAGGRRLPPLLVGLALIAAGLAVLLIGAVATSRYPFAFDRAIIVGLRHWSGPAWLPKVAADITDLGGGVVLTLIVTLVVEPKMSLSIPERALVPVGAKTFVFGIQNDKAKWQEVKIGRRKPGYVEIEFRQGVPIGLDGEELAPLELIDRLNRLAGEHGVGLDKLPYMESLFDGDSLDAMCRLRDAFDPNAQGRG